GARPTPAAPRGVARPGKVPRPRRPELHILRGRYRCSLQLLEPVYWQERASSSADASLRRPHFCRASAADLSASKLILARSAISNRLWFPSEKFNTHRSDSSRSLLPAFPPMLL